MESLSLIDVSSEDELFMPSPLEGSADRTSSGLSENHTENNSSPSLITGSKEGGSQLKLSKQMEQAVQLAESPEQNQRKSSKYNLRKSLAWDSAFFTSEGVLNHEELGIINTTFKKTDACSLPIIAEDVTKSSDSVSTLDNDSWALDNLKVDLFENVRASIQKTVGTGEKAMKLAHPSMNNNPAKGGAMPLGSSMKVEPSSRKKKKSPWASERHGVGNHCEHTSRGATIAANIGAGGITSSKTLSKPRSVLSRATLPTMSTKKSFVPGNTLIRTNNTKDKPGNVVTQKSVVVSKKINGGPCSGTFKSSPSPKPTSNPVCNSSDTAHKSRLMTTSTSRTIKRLASGSITNKASIGTLGPKAVSRSASNPAVSPNSSVKLSSTTTPSSSFNSIASESSSSTLSGFKSLLDSLDASSSSPSLDGASNDKIHSLDKNVINEPSRGNHPRSSSNNSSGAKCYKPSGLKMPTPKFGYFDAKKSQTCNVKTYSQISRQPNLLKATTGVCKTDSVDKLKLSKLQHITATTQNVAITSESP